MGVQLKLSDDITLGNVVLDQASIATLYKVSKDLNQSYFDAVVNLVEEEALDDILEFESLKEFWSSIKDLRKLKKECKLGLLKTNINASNKEQILCKLPEVTDAEWIVLMKNTIKFREKNKYTPQYSGFYPELQRKGVPCRKFVYTITFYW